MSNTTVPNQRIIEVNKSVCDRTNLYTVNNLDALQQAMEVLQSKGGFKLYMYIATNQHNYVFNLSSKHFMEVSGVSRTAYRTAFIELQACGYLVRKATGSNRYIFHDTPQQLQQLQHIDDVVIEYAETPGIEQQQTQAFSY